jgi:uncharacterized protein RhaS with RHS repeats
MNVMSRTLMLLLAIFAVQSTLGFYDPSAGRWINRDPIHEFGGLNLYTFVRGSPIGLVDISGLSTLTLNFTYDSSFDLTEQQKHVNKQIDGLLDALDQCCKKFQLGCNITVDANHDYNPWPAPPTYPDPPNAKARGGNIPIRVTTQPIGPKGDETGRGGGGLGIVLNPVNQPSTLPHECGHVSGYPCGRMPDHSPDPNNLMHSPSGTTPDRCWCDKMDKFAKK